MATHEEARALKEQAASARIPQLVVPTWHATVEPTPEAAVQFLNEAPAQVAGQAFASNRADGQVDVYYFL
jgi:hypothetical protein